MLIKIFMFYFVYFISTFLHELGHIIMTKIFFDVKNCRIEIGIGKNILELKSILIKAIPASGYAYWEFNDRNNYHKSNKYRKIMPALGGPLVSLLMLILFSVIFYKARPSSEFNNFLLKMFIIGNVSIFVSTILPIKYLDNPSDGMCILHILKSSEDTIM